MKSIVSLMIAVLLVIPSAYADVATVHQWQLLKDKSSLEWIASYGGKPIHGQFPEFITDIAFDPALLDKSHASVKITMGKLQSSDHDARENLPRKEWFSAEQYPLATFETTRFKAIDKEHYEATGTLSLRGKSIPVTLPFTIQFFDATDTTPPTHYVRMNGQTILKRLDFGVGDGEWASTDMVANEVTVAIHLEAKMVP